MKKLLLGLLVLALAVAVGVAYFVWWPQQKKEGLPEAVGYDDPAPSNAPDLTFEQPPGPHYDDPLPAGAVRRFGTDRWRHYGHVRGMTYSPDGKLLVTGGDDATVRVWNSDTGRLLHRLRSHKHSVDAVAFSPDGKQLVSAGGSLFDPDEAGGDCALRIWDCATWKEQRRLQGHPTRVTSLAFTPDGKVLASAGNNGMIRFWNPATGEPLPFTGSHNRAILSLAFSPDGSQLAAGTYDHSIRLWGLDGKLLRMFLGHREMVTRVAFSPDGKQLLSSSTDKTYRIWDVRAGEMERTINPITTQDVTSPYRPMALSPDGRWIAGEGDGNHFCLWETDGDDRKVNLCPDKSWISPVAFVPDGRTAAGITIWGAIVRVRLPEMKELPRGGVHQGIISDLAFSSDGKWLTTGGFDQTVWLWNVATGKPLARVRGNDQRITSLAFSPDGSLLAGGA